MKEIKYKENLINFYKDVVKERKRIYKVQEYHAKKRYHKNVKNGDWEVSVIDWDKDLIFFDGEIEGEFITLKDRICLRLSKNGSSVEVERSEIDGEEEFVESSNFLFKKAKELYDALPNTSIKSTPKEQTKVFRKSKKVDIGKYEDYDITIPFLTEKQRAVALQKLNKGLIRLDILNLTASYQEAEAYVFKENFDRLESIKKILDGGKK